MWAHVGAAGAPLSPATRRRALALASGAALAGAGAAVTLRARRRETCAHVALS
jgi:hypothetical protein